MCVCMYTRAHALSFAVIVRISACIERRRREEEEEEAGEKDPERHNKRYFNYVLIGCLFAR